MSIEFREGAVCFAGGSQWILVNHTLCNSLSVCFEVDKDSLNALMKHNKDFQLNTIKQGDYIEASELDTEQKYNDAVEEFGLLGFARGGAFALCYSDFASHPNEDSLICYDKLLMGTNSSHNQCTRKITYPQIMAIGKLKRAMIERDNETVCGKPKADFVEAIGKVKELEGEWTDKHYDNFYHLTEEDIEGGKIKIDAYFVNRMWKINSWDDTGAGFHILKTLPRIANNKNPLNRELVALKKQVDLLCKMHSVNKEDFE